MLSIPGSGAKEEKSMTRPAWMSVESMEDAKLSLVGLRNFADLGPSGVIEL